MPYLVTDFDFTEKIFMEEEPVLMNNREWVAQEIPKYLEYGTIRKIIGRDLGDDMVEISEEELYKFIKS